MVPVQVDNPRQRTFVSVTGPVQNPMKDGDCFDIDVSQYTSAYKGKPREPSILPTRILIPDTPRYQKNKPMPAPNTFVHITGFLTRYDASESSHGIDRVYAEIENISFLGKKAHVPFECMFSHIADYLFALLIPHSQHRRRQLPWDVPMQKQNSNLPSMTLLGHSSVPNQTKIPH